MRQQQAAVGDRIDHFRGGVDRDGHRTQRVVGVAADQADRIPGLGQPGRVGRIQRLDDRAQPNRHRATPLSAIAATNSGHSGRTAARR